MRRGGEALRREGRSSICADDRLSDEAFTETTPSAQHKLHWLASGAELVRSAGCARAPTVFLEGFS